MPFSWAASTSASFSALILSSLTTKASATLSNICCRSSDERLCKTHHPNKIKVRTYQTNSSWVHSSTGFISTKVHISILWVNEQAKLEINGKCTLSCFYFAHDLKTLQNELTRQIIFWCSHFAIVQAAFLVPTYL
jgi:hypothetical protein